MTAHPIDRGTVHVRKKNEKFGVALLALRESLGLAQEAFGSRIGVSRRTLTRWEAHGELPPVAQRKHIATAFPEAPAELRAALVASLDLGGDFEAMVAGPGSLEPAPDALDSALLAMAEQLDMGPGRLRGALLGFLRRVQESGLPIEAACALIGPPAGKKRVRPKTR